MASPDDRQKQREREFEEGIMDAGNREMKRLLEELKSLRKSVEREPPSHWL